MVFGHNLQHMAPFGISTSGFCMVFRYANLICSTTDLKFGAPGVPAGWGPFFQQRWGPEKHDFVKEIVPHGVWGESVRGVWIVWYPGDLWAGPFPPKPSQKIILQGFPHFPKNPWAPLALHGDPLLPLCGAGLYNSRSTHLGGPVCLCSGDWQTTLLVGPDS